MPAVYAHLRFGEEVVKSLPPVYSSLTQKYPEAFALGTQGPDILFYHQPFKANELKTRGTDFHNVSGNEFFRPQAEKLLAVGGETVEEILESGGAYAAYILGFLCHFTLDVACHPTIDAHDDGELTHGKIESELDKYVRRKDGVKLRGYNVAKDCIRGENGCAEAISHVLETPVENIHVSIKTMRKINGFFTTSFAPFHGIAHFFLKIAGMERKFGDMFMHKKDDERCFELCPELYEKMQNAIPRAAALIQRYFNELESFANESAQTMDDIFRYNYSGILFENSTK